ncbi:hypothetical protein CDL15_Pgr000819 [Punica granatum]|uniref:Uncharacterized protein n=1 Tax=Punica granatum TaxID=22663 RepID=A0A218W3E7_PUNGR|nr:hypothetical protein CDL15_Pgr000819 [Punica granatum]
MHGDEMGARVLLSRELQPSSRWTCKDQRGDETRALLSSELQAPRGNKSSRAEI